MKSRKMNAASGFTLIEVIITIVILAIVGATLASYFGTSITLSSLPIFRQKAAARLNDVMEKISAQYSQNPEWQPNTTYAANAVILPTSPKRTGLLYKTTSGGQSATDEPEWIISAITSGSSVTDGGVTWTAVWPTGTPPNVAAPTLSLQNGWVASRQYIDMYPPTIVYPGNTYQYIRINIGTTGTTAPSWASATSSGATVSDGTVTWQCVGTSPTVAVALPTLIGAEGSDYDNTFGRYRVVQNRFIRFDTTNSPATEVDLTGNTTHTDYGKYLKVTIGLHSGDADRTEETLTTLFVTR